MSSAFEDIPTQAPPVFKGDEIHVWRVALDGPARQIALLEALLSSDERARAQRFVLPRDRRRFVVSRGVLRSVLAGYLDCHPIGIEFCYGAHGKPMLSRVSAMPNLHFNLSHSAGQALIALRRGGAVGIDIEFIRRDFACGPIAKRFFCDAEFAWLERLAMDEQHDGFFTLWTRKEAFLKAQGDGVWHDLSRVDVTRSPAIDGGIMSAWNLSDLDIGSEFKAALAAEGRPLPMRMFRWPIMSAVETGDA